MKKGKITVCITIAIACFALATVMCMQFKVVKETDITSIETMREEELRTELANWKKMYKEAQEQYNEKTAKLAEYKEKEQSTEDSSKLVEKELEHVEIEEEVSDVKCDKCGRMMVYKYGRFGKFLACPGYPECKNTKAIVETINVPCPKCGGEVQVRKTKRNKKYYICENNPKTCDFISWNKPKPGEKWEPEENKEESAKKKKTTKRKTKSSKKE